MIISHTPLRISFFGGGTDFKDFYTGEEGCVLSSAIDKFIYVIVKLRYDAQIRVGYTQVELVDRVDELQHELVREALHVAGIEGGIEVNTMADIPSSGSGLGSSSSVTVGVLNALHHLVNAPATLETLAQQACQIEIERLGKPIGRQDQYIAAYGGLRFIRFQPDGQVLREEVALDENGRRLLNQQLLLFYTNTGRKSESVLYEQRQNIQQRLAALRALKAMAFEGRHLLETGDFDSFGRLLHESWLLKKSLASKISNGHIDDIYSRALQAGALGGKVTGAGGGGYLLFFCPRERQAALRQALHPLPELAFHLEPYGSKIIFHFKPSG